MKKFYEFHGYKFDITALQNKEQRERFERRLKDEMKTIYNMYQDYGDEQVKVKQNKFLQNDAQQMVSDIIDIFASVERIKKWQQSRNQKATTQVAEQSETKEKMDIDNIEKPDTQDSNSMAKKRHKSNNRIPDDSLPTYSVKVQSSDNVSYNDISYNCYTHLRKAQEKTQRKNRTAGRE